MTERSRMIMTYALCGFANIGSVGITVGRHTACWCPSAGAMRSSAMVWKALLAGFLATCLTAARGRR
jgi:CNT family concentrative nucleoside transporter